MIICIVFLLTQDLQSCTSFHTVPPPGLCARSEMFPELNSILSSSPENFTEGEFILLSDRQADASFLIHHYLTFYLRARCRVCFLGLVQSFSHYSVVSQRLGVNLTQAKEKGQLVFLEALKASPGVLLGDESSDKTAALDYLRSPCPELRGLYEFVWNSLSRAGGEDAAESWGPPVLIIDDLSVLLSLGVSAGAILDFTHYCQATICSQLQGSMIALVRCDDEEYDEDEESSNYLLKALSHQCSLSLRVEGLSTGYCRDIHGQVEIWWRGRGMKNQRKIFQYKVHDKGASFFAPGTSRAVL
ncbi:elongator complex protein 6 [Astyanax mexicanus]|uniref:Elongator complex protein 6 n=2 Tax=Astyanax mexicanus TaxID=7994 RepID=A0A8T2MHB1_ASTMX|nr:elongator complex protein 6 [Astyanax mexicanus]